MNNELQRMWQEAGVASFEILCRYLPGGNEEIHEKHISRHSSRDLNKDLPNTLQKHYYFSRFARRVAVLQDFSS
jgi:hypothetical protein